MAISDKVFAVIVKQSVGLAQLGKSDIHCFFPRLIAPDVMRIDLLLGSKLPKRFFYDFAVNLGGRDHGLPMRE